MKILEVLIHNFMAIGEAKVDLADRGLVLIQGVNEDDTSAVSNGAGKSSIADALCWCLYGETARGAGGDAVVNDVAKKDCSVTVFVADEDNYYQIVRHRKHSVGKNSLWVGVSKGSIGPYTDISKGIEKLTQELVTQIIGCSLDVFTGTIYAGQEAMPDLPGMTDKQLKMLIEEASGATILEAAYKEASKRLLGANNAQAESVRRLDNAKARLDDAKLRIDRARSEITYWEGKRMSELLKLTNDAKAKKVILDAKTAELKLMPTASELEREIAECDAKIAGVAGEQKELEGWNNRVSAGDTAATVAETALDAKTVELCKAEKKLADLDHKVGCPCGSCARPFTTVDIAPAKKLVADEIATLKNSVSDLSKHVSDARSLVAQLAHDRDLFRASMTDLSATNVQRASLSTMLAGVRALERQVGTASTETRSLLEQAKAKKAEENPYKGQLGDLVNEQINLERDVVAEEMLAVAANEELKTHEAVVKVFSPAGVRAFLLDEVTPFLNDQTAKYLGTLSDGNIQATWTTLVKTAKGELREKFSIEVSNSVGGKTFGLISGGEKRKVRIACALALQDLVARRASKPIELFIGDEIDDALDTAGLERLTTILEEKAKERGSVFIISHNDLKDWVRNSITVKRSGGKSVIEETVT